MTDQIKGTVQAEGKEQHLCIGKSKISISVLTHIAFLGFQNYFQHASRPLLGTSGYLFF